MASDKPTSPAKPKKKRRTHEELRAYHASELKRLEESENVTLKQELARLSSEAQAFATMYPTRSFAKLAQQASGLLKQAEAEIKVAPPQ